MACRLLGVTKIPAIVVDDRFADEAKVQQFLVENVARLRMRPIDRALLISHSRRNGEETLTLPGDSVFPIQQFADLRLNSKVPLQVKFRP